MKAIRFVSAAVFPALLACGCSTMSNTEKGVGLGGAIGAGTGAIIGHATGHTGAGALIGAGVGALSGGLVGHAIDSSEAKTQAQIAAASASGPLGLTDVAQMAQQHISDEVIIQQIRTTGSVYHLSPSDIDYLKQNGVSDAVVLEMQATATRYPRRVYTAAPVYQPVVVYEQPPPPPVGVGIGFVGHFR
jgi:hypothetical protein